MFTGPSLVRPQPVTEQSLMESVAGMYNSFSEVTERYFYAVYSRKPIWPEKPPIFSIRFRRIVLGKNNKTGIQLNQRKMSNRLPVSVKEPRSVRTIPLLTTTGVCISIRKPHPPTPSSRYILFPSPNMPIFSPYKLFLPFFTLFAMNIPFQPLSFLYLSSFFLKKQFSPYIFSLHKWHRAIPPPPGGGGGGVAGIL